MISSPAQEAATALSGNNHNQLITVLFLKDFCARSSKMLRFLFLETLSFLDLIYLPLHFSMTVEITSRKVNIILLNPLGLGPQSSWVFSRVCDYFTSIESSNKKLVNPINMSYLALNRYHMQHG